jgi:hypothetical protein
LNLRGASESEQRTAASPGRRNCRSLLHCQLARTRRSVTREDVEAGADITGHFAAFLSEICDLPPDFGGGSLTVEQILPEGLPAGFSALAVYSGGTASRWLIGWLGPQVARAICGGRGGLMSLPMI